MRVSVAAFFLLISSVMQQTNPAVPTAKPSAEKMDAQSPYDATRDTLYRIYLWATIFGVVGAIGGVLVLIVQTKQTRISANAARDAAIAAKASSQAIVNSERPWLFIEIKTGPVAITAGQVPEHLSFTIGFRNCGKTPAEVVAFDQHPDCRDSCDALPSPPKYSLDKHVMVHTRMVPPGETWRDPGESFFYPEQFLELV